MLGWIDTREGSQESLVAEYLSEHRRHWSVLTTKRKLACFRSFAKWQGEPAFLVDYKPPSAPPGRPHPLPGLLTDILAMYETAKKPHHKAIVVLCALLGLRISEARSVTTDSFIEADDGMVLEIRGKGDKVRYVPISDLVMAYLDASLGAARLRSDGLLIPIDDRGARRAWTTLGRQAGVSRSTATHDGRMTFGTLAYERSDYDIRVVQELLGHASVQTTQGYTGVSEAAMRRAATVV